MRNIIEQILDENNTSNLKIPGSNGEIFTFEQVAVLHLDLDTFVILHPLEDGVHPDDVLVFKVIFTEEIAELILEENATVIEECFEEYYRLFKSTQNKRKK